MQSTCYSCLESGSWQPTPHSQVLPNTHTHWPEQNDGSNPNSPSLLHWHQLHCWGESCVKVCLASLGLHQCTQHESIFRCLYNFNGLGKDCCFVLLYALKRKGKISIMCHKANIVLHCNKQGFYKAFTVIKVLIYPLSIIMPCNNFTCGLSPINKKIQSKSSFSYEKHVLLLVVSEPYIWPSDQEQNLLLCGFRAGVGR